MPKRYSDRMDPALYSDAPPQKTQRSHEQNQERAYIAASRRSDRSIEARIQSARMASDVHKRRTGKAFSISEAIVLKEEMYEEVEDGFPRSYHLVSPHLQSSSAEMNSRVDSYLASRMAMSELVSARDQRWRENEVNSEFAKHFPQADHNLSRRWSTASYLMARPAQCEGFRHYQGQSFGLGTDVDALPPPTLTPESTSNSGSTSNSETPPSEQTPAFEGTMLANPVGNFNHRESAFAADLPPEANMLMAGSRFSQSNAIDPEVFDQQWIYGDAFNNPYEVPEHIEKEHHKNAACEPHVDNLDPVNWGLVSQQNISVDDDYWNTFINDVTCETDHQ
ncbi:hypothetical protein G7Z17_g6318 [Cylindrodendrum hubeiense]|uniref:Uncharacterized protein n=1 Tax=Cylindrodendrum hubeiense TaxID=595255 RepID=A0A9P5HB86_9HYPO|nr:hypothetical protein G7Z17_g6318 [Cylindrodendrum hubeiense]